MPNINTVLVPDSVLDERLASLSESLKQLAQAEDNRLKESLVAEANKILSSFYIKLNKPLFSPVLAAADSIPNLDSYNENFSSIARDLRILFTEFENLEDVVLANFNFIVSELNRLSAKTKSVFSKTGDLSLYSNNFTQGVLFASDSFTGLEKINSLDGLYSIAKADIHPEEGILTLPADRQAQVSLVVSETPIINTISNGVPGNNHQIGVGFHGEIKDITDNNPDTWFEYERVLLFGEDDGQPLVLDLLLNLEVLKVVNFIRINPNNFGAPTQVKIDTVETSEDGVLYTSVKDDIPIADFLAVDEENIFTLAPSTSKFAGEGHYSFTPRKAKFIHVVLKQTTPYVISTTSGEKLRYAIGLRDIQVEAIPYQATGEIISVPYIFSDEIRKVLLLTNQNPVTESILATIQHFVSIDNGNSWLPIQNKGFSGSSGQVGALPEVLSFNGANEPFNHITPEPVTQLMYRALLTRNAGAFSSANASSLSRREGILSELLRIPNDSVTPLVLQYPPIGSSVQILDPRLGSRGKRNSSYFLATGQEGMAITVDLPFMNIQPILGKSGTSLVLTNPVEVRVEGVEWDRGNITSAGADRHVYELDMAAGEVRFGEGIASDVGSTGLAPIGRVSIILDDEHLFFQRVEGGYKALLEYPTAGVKSEFELYLWRPQKYVTQVLQKGATVHHLKPNIVSIQSVSDEVVFNPPAQTFRDGSVELTSAGEYSVDTENGIVYAVSSTGTLTDTTISYIYRPVNKLSDDTWEFTYNSLGLIDGIFVSVDRFESFTDDASITVPTGVRVFGLAHVSVVNGSVDFSSIEGAFQTEVSFIDGRREFAAVIPVRQEIGSVAAGASVNIDFDMRITDSEDYEVIFSNNIFFASEVPEGDPVPDVGDYYIDRTNNRIVVNAGSGTASGGSATYYYDNPGASASGKYSIDYRRGAVYTRDVTEAGIACAYRYTDYRALYDMARALKPSDFSVDLQDKQIFISPQELLRRRRMPSTSDGDAGSYLINYRAILETRTDVADLERFFTPVLKDYALKVITASQLGF